jgi:hypothetical protein
LISIKEHRTIPKELFSEILVINHNNQNIKDFLKELHGLLRAYLPQIGIKISDGITYFFDVGVVKFNIIHKSGIVPAIKLDRNILNIWQSRYLIRQVLGKDSFLCVVAKDNLITDRIYGIILLLLKNDITEEKYKNAIEFSESVSNLISELFSIKYKNHVEKIIGRVYSDSSLIKGHKEKAIFYNILGGIRSVIPFDHSATFLLFNPREGKLQIYAEKISRANPDYTADKEKYYGEQYYNFGIEQFKNLPDDPQIISLEDQSYRWLEEIVKYKSYPIKYILLWKIQPQKKFTFLDSDSLLGLLILCNYTDTQFTNGDLKMLKYFVGIESNKYTSFNFLSFIYRARQNFYGITSESPLGRVTEIENKEKLIKSFEKDIENYLSKILIPSISQSKDKEPKEIKIKILFTTHSKPYGTLLTFPKEIQEYFCSDEFSKQVDNAFYGILHTTKEPTLKKGVLDENWKTLTAIKIPRCQEIKHLCILRNEYVDISHYERLILKFLAEHIGLSLFDFSLLEISRTTMEYLKEITNIGVVSPSQPVREYFKKLLKIAIKYTGSDSGNIYTLSKDRRFLQLQRQEGKGEKWGKLGLNDKGVVPYVARNYKNYKTKPFKIDNIQEFREKKPDIGYIPALKDMSSELTMPMLLGDELWGILNLESSKIGNYDEQKEHIISNIYQKASEIWQQRQLSYALEKTGKFLDETSKQSLSLEEPNIYKICSKQIKELLNITVKSTSAHSTTVRFLDDIGENLILYTQSEEGKKSKTKKISYKDKPNCIVWSAIKFGRLIDIPDVFNIDRNEYPDVEYYQTKKGTSTEYAIPLKVLGRTDGVLNVEGANPFREDEKFIFKTIAHLIELLLIHRTYLVRRTIFDHTTKVSLGIHKWNSFVTQTDKMIEEFSRNFLTKEDFISSLKNNFDSISKNIYGQIYSSIFPPIERITPNMIKAEIEKLTYHGEQTRPNIKIAKEIDNVYFEANLQQFIFILKDLIDNAYREGGAKTKVSISIRLGSGGNNLELFINNTGTRILQNIRPYLFKLPIKKEQELRFGCFIAGIIVSDLGGRIYVKKSNPSGTTIGIKIPCRKNNGDKSCK